MLSKDSTRTELGKRPIPTRGQGDNLNTITYRRSLLSHKPNSYHRGNRKGTSVKTTSSAIFLVVVRLLWQHPGGLEPGLRQTSHGETRAALRPPFFLFHYPLVGSTINVSEVMNLRKLAQARPTMPCIPLVDLLVRAKHHSVRRNNYVIFFINS